MRLFDCLKLSGSRGFCGMRWSLRHHAGTASVKISLTSTSSSALATSHTTALTPFASGGGTRAMIMLTSLRTGTMMVTEHGR